MNAIQYPTFAKESDRLAAAQQTLESARNDKNDQAVSLKVRHENQRNQIERLLAMPDEYPAEVRSKYIRAVYGSGACLVCDSDGAYYITVRL